MDLMIEVNNLTKRKINSKILKKLAGKILKEKEKELNISIALIEPEEIKELNKKYRKKNKPTDVLSFLYKKGEFGEIVICPSEIEKNAKRFKLTFNEELARVLTHGIKNLCRNP